MHLHSLTLRGFKSFASATTFEFTGGINAVVGPNGSGKSNIVDALAWVMGEQGAKTLRGASMQDIIFAGGGSTHGARAPLGRARVSLRFNNSDGSFPVPDAEVEISRTMFRAGGSEYEINGRTARLTDVQDLLAEAGLGAEMHVLIGQGQLDRILHASAAQRREIIEEAAGILKYRRRQDKTARKLETMSANLTRLNDLAAELESQLAPLGEQAASASTARELQGSIREFESRLIACRGHAIAAELATASKRQEQAVARAKQLQTQQRSVAEAGEKLAANIKDKEALRVRTGTEIAHLRELLTRARATGAIAAERLEAHERADITAYDGQIRRARERLEADERAQERTARVCAEAEEAHRDAVEIMRQAAAGVAEREQVLAERAARAEAERTRNQQLAEAAAVARAGYERASTEQKNRSAEVEQLQSEAQNMAERTGRARTTLNRLRAECDAHEEHLQRMSAEREKAEARCDSARESAAALASESAGARERAETFARALGKHLGEQHGDTALIPVLEAIAIAPGWEKAAATALAGLATAAINAPEHSHTSRVLPTTGTAPPIPETIDGATPAPEAFTLAESEALEALTPEARQYLISALAECLAGVYFVPGPTEAHAALKSGARTAIDAHGVRYTRHSELHPAPAATALELAASAREATTLAQETRLAHEKARAELDRARQYLERTLEEERAAAQTAGAAAAELTRAENELARISARTESMMTELARAHDRLQRAAKTLAGEEDTYRTARAAATAYGEGKDGTEAQAQQIVAESLESARATLNTAREHHAETQTELARAQAEHQAATESTQRSRQAHEQAIRARDKAITDREHIRQRLQTARAVAYRSAHLVGALIREIDRRTAENTETGAEIEKLSNAREENRIELRELEAALNAAHTLTSRSETEIARLEARRESLAERARLLTSNTLEDILGTYRAEEQDEEQLRRNLAKTREQLERLGNVNPLALEEYEALTERHRYLREQIADLKKSRAGLNTIMDEVTGRITEVFTAALATINEHYQRIFTTLFPGGQGRLELSDPEHVLVSGVEIFARPEGKKIRRLSLLSGGERSLASLALLIAIFMAYPAPFYALDEVEAALDDRNLGRVLEVLEQLGQRSQLILITHQQRTMQLADTLYGVSMHEGVSTVISQDVQRLRELL